MARLSSVATTRSKPGLFSRAQTLSRVAVTSAAFLCIAIPARAVEPDSSSKGKGVVGGGLLGAELFVGAESLLGVQSAWVYGAGALAGSLGGGFGGYYLERSVTQQTSMLVLTAGMLLVIPSTVMVMSATAYHSPRETTEDLGPLGAPPAETAPPDSTDPQQPRPEAHRSSPTGQPTRPAASVVALSPSGLYLGLPAVAIRNVWNQEEESEGAVGGGTAFEIELFHWVF